MLSSHSNIGQPGKWMIRVDGPVVPCPAGMLNPPLCDSECRPGNWGFGCSLSCHCSGGISCDFSTGVCVNGCEPGWTGHSCDQAVERCFSRFGRSCSSDARCEESIDGPICICNNGLRGDGFRCVIAPTIPLSVEDITNQLLAVDDNRKS
uniref:NIDO domain-containing protein n=1 Tax=Heterorhabditis bacteriophora TaxID=37862 RepID=A0A1I7XJV9_HETBA